MPDTVHDTPADINPESLSGVDMNVDVSLTARQQAIRQVRRRRQFWIGTSWSAVAIVILVVIWATTEYHNAGGWPVHGFSQSSGVHDVWNFWIIYPLGAWLLITAAFGWSVYGTKPISEAEIKREIERQAARRQ